MKKFYLLLTGALLTTLSVVSQRPQSTDNDPKLIFTQDFEPSSEGLSAEDAWAEWQATPVDTIKELYYYNRTGSGNVNKVDIYDGTSDWNLGVLRTDSTTVGYEAGSGIILLNGVVVTNRRLQQRRSSQLPS